MPVKIVRKRKKKSRIYFGTPVQEAIIRYNETDNLAIKRPGNGIEPKHWNNILNKKSTREIQKNELITWDDIS